MTEVPPYKPYEPHHRDVKGGAARAAVFGFSDGLVSNVALVLGVAGADPAPDVVRLAGLAGLVAGACSMAVGEYVSVKAQSELMARELERERAELVRNPQQEHDELMNIYRSRGVDADVADRLATEMMREPELALETHAREELGIDPDELGQPVGAAASSFAAFAVGAFVPLVPWLAGGGLSAVIASVVLTAVAALGVGAMLAVFTGRSKVRSALRQLGLAALAAGITYVVGTVVGVSGETAPT